MRRHASCPSAIAQTHWRVCRIRTLAVGFASLCRCEVDHAAANASYCLPWSRLLAAFSDQPAGVSPGIVKQMIPLKVPPVAWYVNLAPWLIQLQA